MMNTKSKDNKWHWMMNYCKEQKIPPAPQMSKTKLHPKIKIGDKISSDDYCAIGILSEINNELWVIGDFGKVRYENYNADWKLYN